MVVVKHGVSKVSTKVSKFWRRSEKVGYAEHGSSFIVIGSCHDLRNLIGVIIVLDTSPGHWTRLDNTRDCSMALDTT